MARQGIKESPVMQEFIELPGKELSDIVRGCSYFLDDLGSPVQKGYDVFHVVTGDEIVGTPVVEGIDLGGEEVWGRYEADCHIIRNKLYSGMLHGVTIPLIAEAEDIFIGRHDINCDTIYDPPADRGTFTTILGKAS